MSRKEDALKRLARVLGCVESEDKVDGNTVDEIIDCICWHLPREKTTKVINLTDYNITDDSGTVSLNDRIVSLFAAGDGVRMYPSCQEFWDDIKGGNVRVVLDATRLESGMKLESDITNYTKYNDEIVAIENSFVVLIGSLIRVTVIVSRVADEMRIVVASENLISEAS